MELYTQGYRMVTLHGRLHKAVQGTQGYTRLHMAIPGYKAVTRGY